MELKEGMYVRTKKGIYKINDFIKNNYTQKFTYIDNCGCSEFLEEKQVIKASYNIIDLIEVGDYVNGYNVTGKETMNQEEYVYTLKDRYGTYFKNSDIKSIVTKEQFESMSYKVGD